jgi:hypothetical protein
LRKKERKNERLENADFAGLTGVAKTNVGVDFRLTSARRQKRKLWVLN